MKPLFEVNTSLCIKCGACAATCPVKIVEFSKGEVPKPVVWAKKVCIDCGHCVAVCPKGALSLATMPADACRQIDANITPSWGAVSQLLRSRRSIRVYQDRQVEKSEIEKLIHTARYSPTGHNSQSVSWTVVYERSRVEKLKSLTVDWMRKAYADGAPISKTLGLKGVLMGIDAGNDLILRGAPHIIITHASKDDRMAPSSAIITLAYFELAAKTLGLGTCWAGFMDIAASFYPPIREAMELLEGHASCSSMMLGYPKYQYHRIPTRKAPDINWR
ncbi:MAG: nitroreductase family protein [Candidatus Omnitrophica bacterium]|nr:nitroreductase family protein [Candidatus Omnitrophota bacterium]